MVLVQDLAIRRTRSAESLGSTIAHEHVHCALRQHLAPRERVRFLDWIAANVPYQHLRNWFDNRAVEHHYRRQIGIDPTSLLLGGYIDTSPNPTLGGSRANVVHYIKEAFAARDDDVLAGNPTPRARYPAERRVLVFAHRLDRTAFARSAPAGRTRKFTFGLCRLLAVSAGHVLGDTIEVPACRRPDPENVGRCLVRGVTIRIALECAELGALDETSASL